MEVDLNKKAQTLAAVRSVQRFLKRQGYRRGKMAGSSSYNLSKSNVLARDSYVKVMHPVSTAKQPKDYHAMFNHGYFVKWFAKLLAELGDMGVANAYIVMDNAKYHKGRPVGTPTSRLCKTTLQAACTRYGIPFEPTDFKSILWGKLSAYIEKHIQPQVVQMVIDKGHRVIFTPLSLRLATN
ncbi:hypothetical protein DYB36_005030 [Aphanomyces astaci]|uniref:Tc1-like transposase DDE domain-containing protein n=1 Tax=Aphanomyces astaci TaxID=112090 RepID=A0A397B693_APHAT|nr:hypothetical protein DYB36_005030 [Aphanomyces astaci]